MSHSPNLIFRRVGGIVLLVIGASLWFATMAFGREFGMLGGMAAGALGAVSALTGQRMYNRARRLGLAKDGAVPATEGAVIYLRSFGEDSKAAKGVRSGVAYGATALTTEEEQLVKSFSSVGPVIAVGEPNEQLPPLGATRLHFRMDEWQQGVHRLLREGGLVVIRPGSFSPGVRWEIQQALTQTPPERVVLIVGGRAGKHQDADLEQFADQVNPMLPRPLPRSYSKRKLYRLGTVRAFIRFDERWTPTLLPVTVDLVPLFRRSIRQRLVPYFSETLRPVLTSLGYPPPRPRLSIGMVSMIAGFGIFLLLGTVQMFLVFWK